MKVIEGIDAVILDIEGTTTPLDFVHKTLFQFAKQNLHDFLNENINSENVRKALNELSKLYTDTVGKNTRSDLKSSATDDISMENATSMLYHLIDMDSKASQLKMIEGMIWEKGYRDGILRGEVYDDVPVCMKRWASEGKEIYIYSSGSILAQKLIFSSTLYGDLTDYITNYFDTGIGRKNQAESYGKIAAAIGKDPERILFISDSLIELNAAASKGFQTLMMDRDRKMNLNAYPGIISSLLEISI
ncbi:acireductone synthase [Oxyplasma meridianum]|uniref:Acireductone synthase n=1 Tax=Oxyplasma meridianum TaxID=3073602 RepID=A0AAX4NHR9_9ARCH